MLTKCGLNNCLASANKVLPKTCFTSGDKMWFDLFNNVNNMWSKQFIVPVLPTLCMYVPLGVCMYVCMSPWVYVCMPPWVYVCMYVCMSLWVYVCMYLCMYVYVYASMGVRSYEA